MIRKAFSIRKFLCLAILLALYSMAGNRMACAQQVSNAFAAVPQDDDEESEDLEAEEDEEDEDEDNPLGELFYVRKGLEFQLKQQQEAVKETQRRLALIDKFASVAKNAKQLEERIEEADESGDTKLAKKLQAEFERAETEMDVREELIRYEYQLSELTESIEEAEREEDEDRLELLAMLGEGLERIRAITEELLPIYLDGPESAEAPLEQEKAETFTRKVEKVYRALRVLEQFREAKEEEDDERIEELEEQLRELRNGIEGGDKKANKEKVSKAPLIQPILVTEETLAPFANADLHRDVAPLLQQYCIDCHGNDSSSGELNLEKLLAESPIVRNRDQWINVIEQSKNHVMPPEDEQQPSQEDRKRIVLSLHNAIHNFDYSDIRDPGFEAVRRLTHREYSNTVRDLFGIEIDVVDRFPADLTASSGFDNSANSLFIQPLLMERYIGLAEYVVTAALPENPSTTEQKAAHERIFFRKPKSSENVGSVSRELLSRFLLRAFRRPATESELNRFGSQVEAAMQNGADFQTAITATLQTVLISPSFLLLSEATQAKQDAFAISDWELASRLSYFLWASLPDDELLQLAENGTLHEKSVLAAQVQRMIADPKADTLGSVFVAQWLGSQHLGVRMRMDPIDNPWCTESLMTAMRNETSMFFNSLVRENRPIPELISADYTFLNQELAKLYSIKGVKGDEMRRVKLRNLKQRGGIFGQGSLLAVTSFPYRTSPVVRGKWILDNVLGTPPPPPPPNVSELSEEIEENRTLSFREKLELHREKPNCYACHSQMDPLGFSLEQFDWFGRYRTRIRRKRIDASGQLPNGTEFAGLEGLKQVIVEQRRDDLIRQVSQKMLSYALGRQLEYYDEPAIRNIVKRVSADEDRMQTLIHEIVSSFPFRYKQTRPTEATAAKSQASKTKDVGVGLTQ